MRYRALALCLLPLATPAVAESAQSGVWTYTFEMSSDGKGGFVTALAPAPSPTGDPNDPSYVIVRCLGGRTEAMVGGSGGWGVPRKTVDVVTQVGGAAQQTSRWTVSTNGKAAFLDDKVEEFLKSLPDDGKLRVAITDMTGTTREAIFATTGFGVVRARLAEACGWAR